MGKQIFENLMIPRELPCWLKEPNLFIDREQEIFDLLLLLKTERLIQVYGKN